MANAGHHENISGRHFALAVRVRIALYAKGVAPEFTAPPDGAGSEAYRKITPLGKVPSLVCDDGVVIAESAVINEYLDEQFPDPALLPAPPPPPPPPRRSGPVYAWWSR